MWRLCGHLFAICLLTVSAAVGRRVDELAIGVIQFPATLHPSINAMTAKSYVLGMVRRPLTTYDAQWHLVCMLCVALPTIENGLAVPPDLGGGKRGSPLPYTLPPDARWGDAAPRTHRTVPLSSHDGRTPQTRNG